MSEAFNTDDLKHFEYDSLIVHVRHVNSRLETHGEEQQLCVDVSLRLMDSAEWGPVLLQLLKVKEPELDDFVTDFAHAFDTVKFAAAFEEHRVRFRVSTSSIAVLAPAKLNKFQMDFDDIGMTFRVQAPATPDVVGALTGLLGHKLRLETVAIDEAEVEEPEAEPA